MDIAERIQTLPATPEALRRFQAEVAALPQYVPRSRHYFHGGMYCREVSVEHAGVVIVGLVHRCEHFFTVATGRVRIEREEFGPGALLLSVPGTKRAIFCLAPTVFRTIHRTEATTVEQAERELVEEDPSATFTTGNVLKNGVLEWHS